MAQKRDVYEVLGISKSASPEEIKKAYRTLAKKYHPDVSKEANTETKFKEVQEAYDILSDEKKKQLYDQFGHAGVDPQAAGGAGGFGGFGGGDFGGVDLGDIFNSFFGGGRGSAAKRTGPAKGEDKFYQMKISFMDAVKGKTTEITIQQEVDCSVCHGSGAQTPHDVETCSRCHGSGTIASQSRTPFGVFQNQSVCPDCNGTGKIIKNKCSHCNGAGYEKIKTTIELKIPAGINSQQQIRVPNKGGRGINGGPSGALYVEIIVASDPVFKRNGVDIYIDVTIPFPDAALGCTLEVPTVYGDVELKIPEGINDGQKLRIKGKGIKELRSTQVGDQFVTVNVKAPTKLTKEEKELYEKLRSLEKAQSNSMFSKFKKAFKK